MSWLTINYKPHYPLYGGLELQGHLILKYFLCLNVCQT